MSLLPHLTSHCEDSSYFMSVIKTTRQEVITLVFLISLIFRHRLLISSGLIMERDLNLVECLKLEESFSLLAEQLQSDSNVSLD